MPSQSTEITKLIHKRMKLVSSLSEANAEYFRSLQRRSGFDILLMRDTNADGVGDGQSKTENELGTSQIRIEELEKAVTALDAEIEAATRLEEE